MKKSLTAAMTAALLGVGGLALTATGASAYVVCNGAGDCWHVHDQYSYPPEAGIVVHDDNWKWEAATATDAHVTYRWHEHDGRGYWRDGTWVAF